MTSSRSFLGALASITMAGVVLIGYEILQHGNPVAVDVARISDGHVGEDLVETGDVGIPRGEPEAPVVVRVFTDYRCPYCSMVARLTIPQVVSRYVETGKARLILYDLPVHGELSHLGAEAARCAGDQGAYWAMHDILFRRMGEWGTKDDPRRLFRQYAVSLGLEIGTFTECVDSRKYRRAVIASLNRGKQLGVDGAPTFIVNSYRVVGVIGFDRLAAIIEDQLAGN